MSLSDSVATVTENISRLGYKHVCVNYLHVAYLMNITVSGNGPAHTHTHSLTKSFCFFSLNSHLSFNKNSSGE